MAYRIPIALTFTVVLLATAIGLFQSFGNARGGIVHGGPPMDTPTLTPTGTPTVTPTSNRPYQLHINIQDHYPDSPATGQQKTWEIEYGNNGTIYGCATSPTAGLSVTLLGQADTGFIETLGPIPCPSSATRLVTSQVTAGSEELIRIEACISPKPPFANRCVGANDTTCANYDVDQLCNPDDADADGDGCLNVNEENTSAGSEVTGGLREPLHYWDFFDTPDDANQRDRVVTGSDFFAQLGRFGASGSAVSVVDALSAPPPPPAYHAAFDRGPAMSGSDPWDVTAANGSIAATDFFSLLAQFGHDCSS